MTFETSDSQRLLHSLTSPRLRLRPLELADGQFIVTLLNDPDWLKYIGSHNVHSLHDARQYIKQGPQLMYQQHNLGLLLVELIEEGLPIGVCGLLKRPNLSHPDLGFAFLPEYRNQGLAKEAAECIISDAIDRLHVSTILAMTSLDNKKSEKLLAKLGFRYIGICQNMVDTKLFERTAKQP